MVSFLTNAQDYDNVSVMVLQLQLMITSGNSCVLNWDLLHRTRMWWL